MSIMSPETTIETEDIEVTPPDGMAHYVKIKALIQGGAVVALCGKKYVPEDIAGAGSKKICPRCKEMMDMLHAMDI